jgi:hypothetical protein
MKTRFLFVAILFACFSCCLGDPEPEINVDSLAGFWNLQEVTINDINSDEYNFSPSNFLKLESNKTFSRAYESGNWNLKGKNLTLDREEALGMSDWHYQIISITDNKLVVEMQLIESEYRWDFDSFTDEEVLTIREVYIKTK